MRSPLRRSMPETEHTPWGERILDIDPTEALILGGTLQQL